jgi:hypothetical protein
LDSQNPIKADILTPRFFGANGQAPEQCIVDGVAAGWKSVYPLDRPGTPCVKRCFREGFILYSPEANIKTLNGETTSAGLSWSMENGGHRGVHQFIGGTCGDMTTNYSPNDPIFFLHHAMVDRLWWRWQKGCTAFQRMYDGPNSSPSDLLTSFNTRVSDVLNSDDLCYTYGQTAGDLPLNLQCPSPATTTTTVRVGRGSSSSVNVDSSVSSSVNVDSSVSSSVATSSLSPNPKDSKSKGDWFLTEISILLPKSNSNKLDVSTCDMKLIKSANHASDEYFVMMNSTPEQIAAIKISELAMDEYIAEYNSDLTTISKASGSQWDLFNFDNKFQCA